MQLAACNLIGRAIKKIRPLARKKNAGLDESSAVVLPSLGIKGYGISLSISKSTKVKEFFDVD
ncbi:MAG: hypothetical protein QNK37_07520 [Acidobacteriota bacterium]|nr:hypothetical protein [Acidobacteriota bacterium]